MLIMLKVFSIIPYQLVIADFTRCDFFLLLLSCISKLPWLSSKLCLLFIHCSINSPVSASSVAPQGTPGAPGAPGSPGPQGKQGELGPPVSLASRPSNSGDLVLMLLSPVGPRPGLTSRQEVVSVRLNSFLSERYCF